MSKQILKDDTRYLLFGEIYFRLREPKSQRKAFMILESAIDCYARKGLAHVTQQMIARESGISRPALKLYFKDMDDLEDCALKYIRLLYQKLTVDALDSKSSAREMLLAYTNASVMWTEHMRKHAVVWFSFLQRSGLNAKSRALNTLAVAVGTDRIRSLLEKGRQEGDFQVEDLEVAARLIQLMITGAVFSAVSENISDLKKFSQMLQLHCLNIALAQA